MTLTVIRSPTEAEVARDFGDLVDDEDRHQAVRVLALRDGFAQPGVHRRGAAEGPDGAEGEERGDHDDVQEDEDDDPLEDLGGRELEKYVRKVAWADFFRRGRRAAMPS